MIQLTPKQAQALCNLRANEDFNEVLQWLKLYVNDLSRKALLANQSVDTQCGMARSVLFIVEAIEDAPNQLNKMLGR